MKDNTEMKYSATQAARIIGASSPNIISVWANRGLLIPSNVINLTSKKRLFEFSYLNLFQALILKELGDYFLIQYEFMNKFKRLEKGLGNKKLEHAIREGKGFIVVTGNLMEEKKQESKEDQGIRIEFFGKHEEITELIRSSRYALILNIAEISQRLMKRINELEGEGW